MIDRESPPGAWRAALNPEVPSCKACGQSECEHADPVYQGISPAPGLWPRDVAVPPRSIPVRA
jgi:hypothetical protein